MARFSRVYSPGAASFVEASVLRFSRVYRVLHTCISAHCRVRSSCVSSVPGGRARDRERERLRHERTSWCATHDEERGKRKTPQADTATNSSVSGDVQMRDGERGDTLHNTLLQGKRQNTQLYFMEMHGRHHACSGHRNKSATCAQGNAERGGEGHHWQRSTGSVGWQKAVPKPA